MNTMLSATQPKSNTPRTRPQRSGWVANLIYQAVVVLLLIVIGTGVEYRFNLFQRYIAKENPQAVSSTQLSSLFDTTPPANHADANFDTFWQVWDILVSQHLNAANLTTESLVDNAISGLTRATGDAYTYYLTPEQFQETGENMAGRFYGVGIELGYRENILAVISPLDDGPAAKAGVQAGDLILHVKDEANKVDEDSAEWTLEKAVQTIRGERGTQIILTLGREGATEPIDVTLVRDEIKVPSLELEFVEYGGKRVAHVNLSQFGQNTLSEWEGIVSQILKERTYIDGIVVDLRGNSGGFLNTAIAIASDFIKDGVVVSQQDRLETTDFESTGRARLVDIPVVVLVNRGSASASEILAGALRDRVGAKLVGEKTFGKGTVQDREELGNGGGIHVTIAQWLLPNGANIHHTGIPVDVEIKYNPDTEEDEQLHTAIETL